MVLLATMKMMKWMKTALEETHVRFLEKQDLSKSLHVLSIYSLGETIEIVQAHRLCCHWAVC